MDVGPNPIPQSPGQTTTRTARELAGDLNQTLLWVTQSSTPYLWKEILRGLNRWLQAGQLFFSKYCPGIPIEPIRLIPVEERRVLVQPITSIPSTAQQIAPATLSTKWSQPQSTAPLVAYVNFSKLDGQTMGTVLDHLGCPFIPIHNPMQALPCLLKHKPDLIFLDLHLAIANGHELCSQIRRISIFSDTPVIILTHCDNYIDRMRAKVVGSTNFVAKPIGLEKIQAILQQHLSVQCCLPITSGWDCPR